MIGTVPDEGSASRFVDYLLTQKINASAESNGRDDTAANWQIWVEHDDDLDRGKAELDTFLRSPAEAKYDSATDAARIRKEVELATVKRRNRHVDVRTANAARPVGGGVTMAFIAVCVALYLAGLIGTGQIRSWLVFDVAPPNMFDQILSGQAWRVFTPALLHGGPLHLIFNMLWMLQLGGMIEARKGPAKTLGLIVVIAVVSNLLQALWMTILPSADSWGFVGASGVVAGLFGYAWIKGRYRSYEGIGIDPQTVGLMLGWLVICSFGFVGNIANAAHWGGLLTGVLIAIVPVWKRKFARS